MIARLKGRIVHTTDNSLILDVHDVGYKVFVPQKILSIVDKTSEIVIFTYTHIREDLMELYGFSDQLELKLFEQLISVSGIGCKTALGVFVLGSRMEIINAIGKGDVAFFTGVPRLGKKNAQKLIVELKNKFDKNSQDIDLSGDDSTDDVLTALQSFGFSAQEARRALSLVNTEGTTTEQKIRLALKELGR